MYVAIYCVYTLCIVFAFLQPTAFQFLVKKEQGQPCTEQALPCTVQASSSDIPNKYVFINRSDMYI